MLHEYVVGEEEMCTFIWAGRWRDVSCGCFSVAKSCLTLWPHGLQHARPPCPSLSPRVCPSSCSLNQWCHPTISSSVTLFSCCPQSLPASGSFPISWLFTSGGQNIGVGWNPQIRWGFSLSISPSNEYSGLISFRMDWLDLLAVQGTLKNLLQHHSSKASVVQHSAFFMV